MQEEVENKIPVLVRDVPPEIVDLVRLLADPNLTTADIDMEMNWPAGETRRKLNKYPILARTAQEARILAFRKVGLESPRLAAYQVIADALKANKRVYDNLGNVVDEVIDHKIRLEAAQKMLRILGDDSGPILNVEGDLISNHLTVAVEHFKKMSVEQLRAEADKIINQRKSGAPAIDITPDDEI